MLYLKPKAVGENMSKRKTKQRKKYTAILLLLLFIGSIGSFIYITKKNENLDFLITNQKKEEQRKKEEEEQLAREQQEKYNACIIKPYEEGELTEELQNKKQEVNNFIVKNNYKASVYYEDITTGFTYTYKQATVYYGASLIKLVDALYLINKAIAGEIDLDTETVTYTSEYKKAFSSGMSSHNYGDKVTLRELITHAISVSDNSAHMMLYDYIGRENLKNFGISLGSKTILTTGTDKFGNQTAEDTNIYLKEAYKIISENEEYGSFLKEIMDNDVRNSFNTDTIKIYHKYGACDPYYYHDIGLSLENHPYAISILTLHENSNYKEVVQNIHSKIIELQNLFYETREKTCHLEIYGN